MYFLNSSELFSQLKPQPFLSVNSKLFILYTFSPPLINQPNGRIPGALVSFIAQIYLKYCRENLGEKKENGNLSSKDFLTLSYNVMESFENVEFVIEEYFVSDPVCE